MGIKAKCNSSKKLAGYEAMRRREFSDDQEGKLFEKISLSDEDPDEESGKSVVDSLLNPRVSGFIAGLQQSCRNASSCWHGLKQRAMNIDCRACVRTTCTATNVKKKLPILEWLPKYRSVNFPFCLNSICVFPANFFQ